MGQKINFLIIGGSGHLCELNHYPAIRSMNKEGIATRVVAICDPQDPRSTNSDHYKVGRENLNAILSSDNPLWVNPADYTEHELKHRLSEIATKEKVDVVVIATDPTYHYFYADWAVSAGISVLCDKPLIVVPDASWKPEKAKLIEKRFQSLYKKVQKAQKVNPDYCLCVPLRRRALSPFVTIAESLRSVYDDTNEGITYMTAVINSGVHRYPIEFLKGGAHGYLDGVGSLSHSSYHYLDVIAWYLQCSPGKVAKISITLPYVARVRDYLARQGYSQLLQLNNEDPSLVASDITIPDRVLNAELDFTVQMHLYNNSNNKIGLITYTSNHTTFSPRTTKYDPQMLDHTNDENGGRMSHIYFDIHQGSVQNWSLLKNDVVFEGNEIEITQRLHSKLGKSHTSMQYADAYDSETVTLKDLFTSFSKKSVGIPVPKEHEEQLQLLHTQILTHRIFSAVYELIAQDYVDPGSRKEIIIDIKRKL